MEEEEEVFLVVCSIMETMVIVVAVLIVGVEEEAEAGPHIMEENKVFLKFLLSNDLRPLMIETNEWGQNLISI